VRAGGLVLPNCDLDDGKATAVLEYSLADDAYASLLNKLSTRKFEGTSPQLRDNILEFYSSYSTSTRIAKTSARSQGVVVNVNELKAATLSVVNGPTMP